MYAMFLYFAMLYVRYVLDVSFNNSFLSYFVLFLWIVHFWLVFSSIYLYKTAIRKVWRYQGIFRSH